MIFRGYRGLKQMEEGFDELEHLLCDKLCFIDDKMDLSSCAPG